MIDLAKFLKDIIQDVSDRGVTKSVFSQKEGKHVKSKMSKEEIESVLREAIDVIGDYLQEGEMVYLIGLVNLEPKDYGPKLSFHPQTQKPMTIPGYRGLLAKPSGSMKEKLAKGYSKSNEEG